MAAEGCVGLARLLRNGASVHSTDWNAADALLRYACGALRVKTACTELWDLDWSDVSTFRIDKPVVNAPVTDHKDIRFRPFDVVEVTGGGCVNTHGVGKTTKRFVDPDPYDNYYGQVEIPGYGLQPIRDLRGRMDLQVKAVQGGDNSKLYLRYGYVDDPDKPTNILDNDYDDFDNGNNCKDDNLGPAWIGLTVHHETFLKDSLEAIATMKGMDLYTSLVDPNIVPVNPQWIDHIKHPERLPNAGALCNYFEYSDGKFKNLGDDCVSLTPTVNQWDPPSWLDWAAIAAGVLTGNPVPIAAALLDNTVMRHVCTSDDPFPGFGDQQEALRDETVRGHINWTVATYNGTLWFSDFQVPPGNLGPIFEPLADGDGDYDWGLTRPDLAGVISDRPGNRFGSAAGQTPGLVLEFLSNDIVDMTHHGWWQQFHDAVDSRPDFRRQAWDAAQAMVNGREAIVVGLLGIDTKHFLHAELHPVYAMAIHEGGGGGREKWAFFVRDNGSEGGCGPAREYMHPREKQIQFYIPRQLVWDRSASEVYESSFEVITASASGDPASTGRSFNLEQRAEDRIAVARSVDSTGTIVSVDLSRVADRAGLVYGELELCVATCTDSHIRAMIAPAFRVTDPVSVAQLRSAARPANPESPPGEESEFSGLAKNLSRDQAKRFANAVNKGRQSDQLPIVLSDSLPTTGSPSLVSAGRVIHAEDAYQLHPTGSTPDSATVNRSHLIDWALINKAAGGDTARALRLLLSGYSITHSDSVRSKKTPRTP